MRRLAAVALAALLLAAAGCGESPEDKARNAGEAIGGDVYDAQNATTDDTSRSCCAWGRSAGASFCSVAIA